TRCGVRILGVWVALPWRARRLEFRSAHAICGRRGLRMPVADPQDLGTGTLEKRSKTTLAGNRDGEKVQTTLKNGAPGGWAASGALVMGADYRALGVVRSLGRHRIPVWLVNQGGHLVATASRYVRRRLPWPACDDHGKINFLLRLCASHNLNGWALIPTDDHTVALVSNHHEALSAKYHVTVPAWETLQWACDKRLLHQLAQRLQVHQPWTFCPSTRQE